MRCAILVACGILACLAASSAPAETITFERDVVGSPPSDFDRSPIGTALQSNVGNFATVGRHCGAAREPRRLLCRLCQRANASCSPLSRGEGQVGRTCEHACSGGSEWHTLVLKAQCDHLALALDGRPLLAATDATTAGKIALWT